MNDFGAFPKKIRHALNNCHYKYSSDSTDACRKKIARFYQGTYSLDGSVACIISDYPSDSFPTNSALLLGIAGDSVQTFCFRIPDSVKTISGAIPFMTWNNELLFGGGIMTKHQSEKYERKLKRKYAQSEKREKK
ncbi:MAG: hypothetical protein HY064_00945 [Bacteroidetes bacterium]|nr:hypothetical protein [Bacteroidota bacterium]